MNLNVILLKFKNTNSAMLSMVEYEVLREQKFMYNNWPTGDGSQEQKNMYPECGW